MQFSVHLQTFKEMANQVLKVTNSKDANIQTQFKIVNIKDSGNGKSGDLVLQCYSGTSFFKGVVNLLGLEFSEEEKLEYCIDGIRLKNILSISKDFDTHIVFKTDNSKSLFKVNIFKTQSYILPIQDIVVYEENFEIKHLCDISKFEFMSNIQKLSKVLDTSYQDRSSSCLHLSLVDNKIEYVGTNLKSIAKINHDLITPVSDENIVLLKPYQINMLLQSDYNPSEVLELITTETMFGYQEENLICLVAKISLNPLSYKGVINSFVEGNDILIHKSEFKDALDSLGKLSIGDSLLKFHFTKNNKDEPIVMISNDGGDKYGLLIESLSDSFEDIIIKAYKNDFNILFGLLSDKFSISLPPKDKQSSFIIKTLLEDKENEKLVNNDNVFLGCTNQHKE